MDLEKIRQDIDQVDKELVKLLEKRMALVGQVTAFKQETGKAVLDNSREEVVLKQVASQVVNKDYEATILATFKDIIAQSRAYQTTKLG